MNLHLKLIGSTLTVVAGLGITHALASEPASQTLNQQPDLCQQAGADYRKLYTIEEATRSITICQKGEQYYHIITAKQSPVAASSVNQVGNAASSTTGNVK